MSFERQLAIFVIIAATVITFVACLLLGGVPINISLLISIGVLLGGLLFGRRFAEFIIDLFS
jgi:hypothetical protein